MLYFLCSFANQINKDLVKPTYITQASVDSFYDRMNSIHFNTRTVPNEFK